MEMAEAAEMDVFERYSEMVLYPNRVLTTIQVGTIALLVFSRTDGRADGRSDGKTDGLTDGVDGRMEILLRVLKDFVPYESTGQNMTKGQKDKRTHS